uniref:Uncharacterized protein n=1 Tax=Anopheles atroparvus TaxID=41427 RepID=A0A182J0B5_ANOAO
MDGSSPNAVPSGHGSPIAATSPGTGCYAIRQHSASAGTTLTATLSASGTVPGTTSGSASSQPVAVAGAASHPVSGSAGPGQQSSLSPRRRARLQRSERLQSDNSQPSPSYSSWEALIRDSFGQIVWPIRITSWEVVQSESRVQGSAGVGLMPVGRNVPYHVPDYVAAR